MVFRGLSYKNRYNVAFSETEKACKSYFFILMYREKNFDTQKLRRNNFLAPLRFNFNRVMIHKGKILKGN